MASGHWITHHASKLVAIFFIASYARLVGAQGGFDAKEMATSPPCTKPLYLTLDTGHMAVAPLVAEVLQRQGVKATFFAANERTQVGDGSLGDHWAAWWKARAGEGHALASHTFNHVYWRADGPPGSRSFRVKPTAGAMDGRELVMTAAAYCDDIAQAARRLEQITGVKPLALYRAPGGKTSPALLEAARSCGYTHVGWSPAGFLGDELPSDRYPNPMLLQKALRDLRSGDILLAHLGIWSRQDAWAPAVLEPLIAGLKARGFCFRTLLDHPVYGPLARKER